MAISKEQRLITLTKLSVNAIIAYIIRSLNQGDEIRSSVINTILDTFEKRFTIIVNGISKDEVSKVIVLNKTNLEDLKAFQLDRDAIFKRVINGIKKFYSKQINTYNNVSFGRQARDTIRELGLRNVLKGIKTGSIQKSRKVLEQQLIKKIPIVDGKIAIETTPYDGNTFRRYDPRYYAELVAETTRVEANTLSTSIKAKELGTRLITYNFRGTDYLSINDPCWCIDGRTYSIEPQGSFIHGVFFPYFKDAFKGNFLIPHPNCKHNAEVEPEIDEAHIKSLKVGRTFSEFMQKINIVGAA